MKCSEIIEILECNSFTDDISNIEPNKIDEMNIHLNSCAECEKAKDKIREFDLLLKARLKNVKVPLNLKSKIVENINNYSYNDEQKISFNIMNRKILTMMASIIVFVVIFLNVPIFDTSQGFDDIITDAIFSHNKNLNMDIVCDENSEISNLEKWIDDNVNFNVSLANLQDFNIIGARECHLCDEKVAYIFLEKDGVKYSMFIINSDEFDKISFDSQTSIVDNHNIKFWQTKQYGYFIVNTV